MQTIKTFFANHPTIQRYIISSFTTFFSTFLLTAGALVQLKAPSSIVFTWSFLFSIVGIAGRAGVKAVVETGVGQHADLPTT